MYFDIVYLPFIMNMANLLYVLGWIVFGSQSIRMVTKLIMPLGYANILYPSKSYILFLSYALGDFFLTLDDQYPIAFIFGILSFSYGHLYYLYLFNSKLLGYNNARDILVDTLRLIPCVLIGYMLLGHKGGLLVAIAFYSCLLGFSMYVHAKEFDMGMRLIMGTFIASDILLAFNMLLHSRIIEFFSIEMYWLALYGQFYLLLD